MLDIKSKRVAVGLTQSQFAQKLRVGQSVADADPQANATRFFGINGEDFPTVLDILNEDIIPLGGFNP